VSRESVGRSLLLVPVVLLGLAMAIVGHDPSFAQAPLDYLFDGGTGVVIVLAGLVAWDRRPERLTGRLLVLAGYLWYVGSLYVILPDGTPIPFLAFGLRGYYDPILAFVVLSFTGDRLETRRDRTAVLALLGAMVIRSAWRLAGAQPGVGTGEPPYQALLVRDAQTFQAIDATISLLVAVALVGIAVAALLRRSRIRVGSRFVIDPVLLGGAIWAGLAAPYVASDFFHVVAGFDIVPYDGPGWTVQYVLRILGPLGILLGTLRLSNRSAAVVAVMAGPAGHPRGPELESALRDALDDPSLVLLYRDDGDGWLDATGRPALLPQAEPGRATTVLESDGRVAGAVVHDAVLLDDPSVVRTLAAVVQLAVDNERLQDDLRGQLAEVRASRTRIVEAADAERRRVERDLHDGAQQRLVALAVSVRTIRARLGPDADPAVTTEVEAAAAEVKAAIAEVRELARGLDPAILREAGLAAGLQSLADRSPVPVRTELDIPGRLPPSVETAAYFAASEALANVAKHAAATSVSVSAAVADDRLRLAVVDDGVGGADVNGSGLRGLVDRISAVDGILTLRSVPGEGTSLLVSIPCAS
jgi:signal transduction histidine kinase